MASLAGVDQSEPKAGFWYTTYQRGIVPSLRLLGLSRFTGPAHAVPSEAVGHLVEEEIIPRLIAAHSEASLLDHGADRSAGDSAIEEFSAEVVRLVPERDRFAPRPDPIPITPEQIELVAPLALRPDPTALFEHVEGLLARGCAPETIFVELLAPAARELGRY